MSANTDALALKGGALGPDGLEEGEEPATGRCDGHTTALNFRSLPRRFSAQDLAAEVELYMPRTTFDLVYVPWSRRKNNHVGYGFVNFVDPESAARACDRMNGQEWRRGTRAQPIKIVPARVQGFGGTLDNFMSQGEAFEHHPDHLPIVFLDGAPVDLDLALSRRTEARCEAPRLAATSSGSGSGTPFGSESSASSGVAGLAAATAWHGDAFLAQLAGLARWEQAPLELAAATCPVEGSPQRCGGGSDICAPPGLEDLAVCRLKRSPGYATSQAEVGALLRKLLTGRHAACGA